MEFIYTIIAFALMVLPFTFITVIYDDRLRKKVEKKRERLLVFLRNFRERYNKEN